MNEQDQIFIIAGFLGFTFFLFFILICVLFSWVQKLRQENGGGIYISGGVGGRSGDVLEKRGFSEYKGPTVVERPMSMPPAATHGGLSRQMSTAGYSSYQPPPPPPPAAPSSVVKAHTSTTSAYGNPHAQAAGYAKSGYDNSAYADEREAHHRDLTAGGVRVLPSTASIDHQIRRSNNYENY